MQTRKLQQVGGGTYTVSIPKDWAELNALEAGMELNLYTHSDGSIVVRASERDGGDLAAVRVPVDGTRPELVARALRSAHSVGFERVTLVPADAFTDAQRRAARSVVRGLVGSDLVVASDEEITVRHLLDPSTVSVRQSVVQLRFMALSVHREGTAAAVEGDAAAADRLADRQAETDRLARMVARHFARSLRSFEEIDRLGVSRSALFDYYVAARELGRVAGLGVEAARVGAAVAAPLPDAVATEVEATAETARAVVDDATEALLAGTDAAVNGTDPAVNESDGDANEDDGDVTGIDRDVNGVDADGAGAAGPVADGNGSGTALAHDALDRHDETVADLEALQAALLADERTTRAGEGECSQAAGMQVADHSAATAVAASRVLDHLAGTADAGGAIADVALRSATRADGTCARPTDAERR